MLQFDDPKDFNIILTDLNLKDIREEIPKILKIEYLSDSSKESDGDINGIIYGTNHRLFCATTVKYKDKIKIVTFLVDTGSAITYISEEVLEAFSIYLNPNYSMEIQINGRETTIMASLSYFKEVSVLGMGFIIATKAHLYVYSDNRSFYLNFPGSSSRRNPTELQNSPKSSSNINICIVELIRRLINRNSSRSNTSNSR